MTTRLFSIGTLVVSLATAANASAHAGVPIATEVLFSEKNGAPSQSYATTFGLISVDTDGQWRLMCEETKEEGRKLYKLWPDGEVGMAYTSGYLYSEDGCNFTRATGVTSSARTLETAKLEAGATPVLVLLTDLADGQDIGTNLHVSGDRGRTFQRVLLPKPVNILSMVVSRTVPPEVVVTGDLALGQNEDGSARKQRWLMRSSVCVTNPQCDVADWTLMELSDPELAQGVTKVLALLPEGLFLRNVTGDESKLFRSIDQGHSFSKVLPTATQSLPNPIDFLSRVGANDLWLSAGLQQTFHSTDGGLTWERRPDMGDIRCIDESAGTLHSCVVDLEKNTVASKSVDGGKSWSPELRYDQIAGIKQCPADSDVATACTDLWLLISLTFKGQQGNPPVVQPVPTPEKSGCSSVAPACLSVLLLALRRRRAAA